MREDNPEFGRVITLLNEVAGFTSVHKCDIAPLNTRVVFPCSEMRLVTLRPSLLESKSLLKREEEAALVESNDSDDDMDL